LKKRPKNEEVADSTWARKFIMALWTYSKAL